MRAAAGFAGVAVCCCALAGCRGRDAATTQPAASNEVVKSVERGPVKLTVRVAKGQVTIAEKVNLTIDVQAAPDVDVDMPSFGEKLNEFEIMDFSERAAMPVDVGQAGGGRKWTQEYVLESFLSGDLEVPAVTVKFHDRREPAAAKEGEISSEPFTVKVTSLLAGDFDPKRFRDVKGTVELPVERRWGWLGWTLGTTGALVVVAVLIWLLRRRIRRAAVPRQLLPHEWAFFALQRLEEDALIEAGRLQDFYFRLSGIVREYIERRFGLMAPERTTPEFLTEVRAAPSLSGEHKRLLGDFLQAADMVKFARYEPAAGEVQAALGTAREFVDQTTPRADGHSPEGLGEDGSANDQRVEEVQA